MTTVMSESEIAAALVSLHSAASDIADLLNVPVELRPALSSEVGDRYWLAIDFHEQDDGDDVSEYRYYFWTREQGAEWVLAEAGLQFRDAFLFEVFRTIAHQMVWSRLGRPKPGDFDRRHLIEGQIELLGQVRPSWATKLAKKWRMDGELP